MQVTSSMYAIFECSVSNGSCCSLTKRSILNNWQVSETLSGVYTFEMVRYMYIYIYIYNIEVHVP